MFRTAEHRQVGDVVGYLEGTAAHVVDGLDARRTLGSGGPGHRDAFAAETPDPDDQTGELRGDSLI